MTEAVVITGAAAITALGADLDQSWESLCAGATAVAPVRGFDASTFPCALAAQLRDPLPVEPLANARDASLLGRHGASLLRTARAAVADAGVDLSTAEHAASGFFAAMGAVDPALGELEAAALAARTAEGIGLQAFLADGYRRIHPLWPLSMLNNISFCIVATALGVGGENAVFSPGADGVVAALSEAAALVREGRAARALVAGVSSTLSPMSLARAHLEARDGAAAVPRPPGEGCGVLVVETQAAAQSRGRRARAVVAGWSAVFGVRRHAAVEAMEQAVAAAGCGLSGIDLVMLHGGPTVTAREEEEAAVRRVFGSRAGLVADSKVAIGHLGAGAGAVDLCLAMRALESGRAPQAFLLPPRRRGFSGAGVPWPRAVVVNAHGASGQCASVVLTRVEG